MATILHFGPYYYYPPGGMPVGGAYNVAWGPDDRFAQCTFNVTGHADPIRRNSNFTVWVTDMSLQVIDVGHGDIDNDQYTAYATFGNDGAETVTTIIAYLTVTTP
jgi:hypothetical protein